MSLLTGRLTTTTIVLLTLFISACSTIPSSSSPPSTAVNVPINTSDEAPSEQDMTEESTQPDLTQPGQNQPDLTSPPVPQNSAQKQLLSQADQHFEQGQYEQAVAIGERLLRINRNNAEVYLLLAKAHFANGLASLAKQFARQGLAYAKNAVQKRALQSIINNY